jgi:hypothetical protein
LVVEGEQMVGSKRNGEGTASPTVIFFLGRKRVVERGAALVYS